MGKEIQEYLESMSRLLNGQLRGAINAKAREENLQLISLTLDDVFRKGYGLGKLVKSGEMAIDELRKQLGIENGKSNT